MDTSGQSQSAHAASAPTPQSRRPRLSPLRFLAISALCGYFFFVAAALIAGTANPNLPLAIYSVLIALAVAMPPLWILAPEIRVLGFRGVPATRLLAVTVGFVFTSLAVLFVSLTILFHVLELMGVTLRD
jgi:hypothetical protein